jgi:hypothetical protein
MNYFAVVMSILNIGAMFYELGVHKDKLIAIMYGAYAIATIVVAMRVKQAR